MRSSLASLVPTVLQTRAREYAAVGRERVGAGSPQCQCHEAIRVPMAPRSAECHVCHHPLGWHMARPAGAIMISGGARRSWRERSHLRSRGRRVNRRPSATIEDGRPTVGDLDLVGRPQLTANRERVSAVQVTPLIDNRPPLSFQALPSQSGVSRDSPIEMPCQPSDHQCDNESSDWYPVLCPLDSESNIASETTVGTCYEVNHPPRCA